VQAAQTEYPLGSSVADVINVYPMSADTTFRDDFGFFFGFPFFGFPSFGGIAQGGATPRLRGNFYSYSSLVQWLQYVGQAKRIFSRDESWEFLNGVLYIMPAITTNPNGTGTYWYDYKKQITADDLPNLSPRDDDIFVEYSVADAKEYLGRLRSKYSSVPGASFETSLDGTILLDESKAKKEELLKYIIETAYPTYIIRG
jgi:hypothetical protein